MSTSEANVLSTEPKAPGSLGGERCRSRCRSCRIRWRRFLLWCGAALLAGQFTFETEGVGMPVSELQLKAAWLLNFAKLTEWPNESFSSPHQPIMIGVMGDPDFARQLERSLDGKQAHGREVVVQTIRSVEKDAPLHMLYMGDISADSRMTTLKALKDASVLTIDGSESFEQSGSILKFLRIDKKIRFDVDLQAAQDARVKISPKLLQVAHSVKDTRRDKFEDQP